MKRRYINNLLSIVTIALIGVMLSVQAMASSETLDFETQGLDLDTGTVVEVTSGKVVEANQADFFIAYNADVVPHAVLIPATEHAEMAFLSDVAFPDVTVDSISGLTFTAAIVDEPLGENDTVILRTDTGTVFKLGNAVEGETSVTVSYEQL